MEVESENIRDLPWLPELLAMVNVAFDELQQQRLTNQPDLKLELDDLEEMVRGWKQSLANSKLDPRIREQLEAEWAAAAERMDKISQALATDSLLKERANEAVREAEILDRLQRLPQVLAEYGPTRGNLELSFFIDRITCQPDGRVELRTCKLGALPEVADMLAETKVAEPDVNVSSNEAAAAQSSTRTTGPRRRGRLRTVDGEGGGSSELRDAAEFAANTRRFSHLSDQWFWIEVFQAPSKRSWADENAERVWARHQQILKETGKTPSRRVLATEFGKSRPTIKAAIDIATGKRTKSDKGRRKFNAPLDQTTRDEIIRLYKEERDGQKKIADRLGIHRNTVDRILNAWDKERGEKRPDGRRRGRRAN